MYPLPDRLKPTLPQVTVCAVDCTNPVFAAKALAYSARVCEFGRALLLSDTPVQGPFEHRVIPRITSSHQYSAFMLQELHRYIDTEFVLIIQWDGYVVHPRAWTDEFLQYDYIGARWHWHNDGMTVGNGGFSLRSRKLLETLAKPRYSAAFNVAEDVWLARAIRPFLEAEAGIRFAPPEVADQFSYERCLVTGPTFGFHGLFNLWRYMDDESLLNLFAAGDLKIAATHAFLELMMIVYLQRKFELFISLYALARQQLPLAEFRELFTQAANFTLEASKGETMPIAHAIGLGESMLKHAQSS
jgi:hypothetical protein